MDQNNTAQNSTKPSSGIDVNELKQFAKDQLAGRPDEPTPFTRGSNPDSAKVLASTQAENKDQIDDPLAKLFNIVKTKDGGAVDVLKVKKTFVINKTKVNNKVLRAIVQNFRNQGKPDSAILEFVLKLDELTEDGKVTEDYFLSFQKGDN